MSLNMTSQFKSIDLLNECINPMCKYCVTYAENNDTNMTHTFSKILFHIAYIYVFSYSKLISCHYFLFFRGYITFHWSTTLDGHWPTPWSTWESKASVMKLCIRWVHELCDDLWPHDYLWLNKDLWPLGIIVIDADQHHGQIVYLKPV